MDCIFLRNSTPFLPKIAYFLSNSAYYWSGQVKFEVASEVWSRRCRHCGVWLAEKFKHLLAGSIRTPKGLIPASLRQTRHLKVWLTTIMITAKFARTWPTVRINLPPIYSISTKMYSTQSQVLAMCIPPLYACTSMQHLDSPDQLDLAGIKPAQPLKYWLTGACHICFDLKLIK